jgi:hypothetical protein
MEDSLGYRGLSVLSSDEQEARRRRVGASPRDVIFPGSVLGVLDDGSVLSR